MTAPTRRLLAPLATAGHWLGGLPRLFWVLWTGILINRLGTLVEPFLGVYLVAARGFSVTAAGAVLAVYALGSIASQILGGWLADRLGRRAALTAGMLANGSSLIALGYVTAAPAVITMTFAAGATINLYRPAAQALIADLIPAAGRARAFRLISWAANLGFSAAMLSGGLLAQAGFRWLFWADALTCAAFAALAWRALPATSAHPVAQARQSGGLGDVLRDRVMAGFMLVVLGQMVVYQQGFTTLPIAMHAASLPPRDYGLVMALNGILIVVIEPLAGTWLGRRDQSLVIVAGNVLLGAGFAVTCLASSLLGYGAAVSIWTLGEIATVAAGAAVAAGRAPAHLREPLPGDLRRRLFARCTARSARRHPAPRRRSRRSLAQLRCSRRGGGARPARAGTSPPKPHTAPLRGCGRAGRGAATIPASALAHTTVGLAAPIMSGYAFNPAAESAIASPDHIGGSSRAFGRSVGYVSRPTLG